MTTARTPGGVEYEWDEGPQDEFAMREGTFNTGIDPLRMVRVLERLEMTLERVEGEREEWRNRAAHFDRLLQSSRREIDGAERRIDEFARRLREWQDEVQEAIAGGSGLSDEVLEYLDGTIAPRLEEVSR